MKKVLVCGGRDMQDANYIEGVLDRLNADRGPFDCMILGMARGVDRITAKWARKRGILIWEYLPEWHRARLCDADMRNQQMVVQASLVIVFPGGIGTEDMLRKAEAAFIEIIEVKGM